MAQVTPSLVVDLASGWLVPSTLKPVICSWLCLPVYLMASHHLVGSYPWSWSTIALAGFFEALGAAEEALKIFRGLRYGKGRGGRRGRVGRRTFKTLRFGLKVFGGNTCRNPMARR